jgi:glutamine amidotransferase
MRIVILDYGMGNIKSIYSTLKYLGVKDVILSNKLDEISISDKIILPGVGSFAKAMENIKSRKIDLMLKEEIGKKKKPILGICLGMQLLGESSTEDGDTDGLGYINAKVTRFEDENIKIPHVGFNQVIPNQKSILYNNLGTNPDFYFTHSYKMYSEKEINQSMCNYGNTFIASFEYENIYGVQFHPELSQNNGLMLLQNFLFKT